MPLLRPACLKTAGLLCCHRHLHSSASLFKVIPKNLAGKSTAAQNWLTRQLNDPYVKRARKELYRARSAFKLIEIHERVGLLRPGLGVVECGCSPGSWTQVLVKHCNAVVAEGEPPSTYDRSQPTGRVVGLDLLSTAPVPGATLLSNADFNSPAVWNVVLEHLRPHSLDLVLSDMAPNASGEASLDHDNIIKLAYSVAKFALKNASEGSSYLCKVWQGSKQTKLIEDLGKYYKKVKVIKPPCSRDNSREVFIYASCLRKISKSTAPVK